MTNVRRCVCGKDCFPSRKAASTACKTMGNTFRVYICHASGTYHVTKQVGPQEGGLTRKKRAAFNKARHGE